MVSFNNKAELRRPIFTFIKFLTIGIFVLFLLAIFAP